MAKRAGNYEVLKNPNQTDKKKQVVIGETTGYRMREDIALVDFRGAKLECGRNWEYSFEGRKLIMRGLGNSDLVSVTHKDWRDINIIDFILTSDFVYLLIVQSTNPNTLSMYILTLNGELVTQKKTQFGQRNKSLNIRTANFVLDSHSVCLFLKTDSLTSANEQERVKLTPGSVLILIAERVWYSCSLENKQKGGNFISISSTTPYWSPVLRDDDLFFLQQTSNRPRIVQVYNFKSQDSREIILQFGNGFLYSEEKEANLLSSTYCIDEKRNKILVPYTQLRGFFKHHLILRVFNMNGMIEKEEVIWVCENLHDTMGDSNIFPVNNFATWSWPVEPINIVMTDNGDVLITWFSGSVRSGCVFSTLTKFK